MKLSTSEYIIIGSISFVITAFSLLFYFDITQSVKSSDADTVGTITFKRHIAQRKYSDQVVWEDIKQEEPVYNFDSIRTADMSEAVIHLKDGTEITLDENSMILISLKENKLDIDFNRGSIKANRDNVNDKSLQTLQIKSGGALVSIDKSDISLSQEAGRELSLTVNKGDATIKSGDNQQRVGEDQKVIASDEDLKLYELNLKLISPEPRSYFTIANNAKTQTTEFSWETVKGAFNITFEVSEDKNFETIKTSKIVSSNTYSMSFSKGTYYWRLRARNKLSNKMELSETRRFTVLSDDPVSVIAPKNNSIIYYRTKAPLITFKWMEDEIASSYQFTVATDKEFQSVINTTEINTPAVNLYDLEKGTYYWKVIKKSSLESINLKGSTPVMTLFIEKRDEVQPPILISPDENKKINALLLDKKSITFSWKNNEETGTSVLDLSKDKDFTTITFSSESNNNFLQLDRKLSPDTYFWRVQGILKDGDKTPYSEYRTFAVIKSEEITLMRPRNNEELTSSEQTSGSNVNFSWEPIDISGTFTIKVSRDSFFTKTVFEETTTDFYYNKDLYSDGTYYWRVSLKDENNKEIMTSKIHSFVLLSKLAAPGVISPANGVTVDMLNKKSLSFSWNNVPGASHYKFSLFQKKGGSLQWITDIETKDTSCTIGELNKLDVGAFYWTLQGIQKDTNTNTVRRKGGISKNSFFIKLGGKDQKIKIKIPDVIYVN